MTFNPKSLANLRPRIRFGVQKERLDVYLPSEYKEWLKKNHKASYKIEMLIDLFMRLALLLEKVRNGYSGYRANGFTQGLKDLEEIGQIVKEIL